MRLDAVGREIVEAAACAHFLHETALGAEEHCPVRVALNRHLASACLAWAEAHGAGSVDMEREIERTVERRRGRPG